MQVIAKLFIFLIILLIVNVVLFSRDVFGKDIREKNNESTFCDNCISVLSLKAKEENKKTKYQDIVIVGDQKAFDSLDIKIKHLLQKSSPSILIVIDSGSYYFRDRHINITGVHDSVDLKIIGNGCVLYGKGRENVSECNPNFAYIDSSRIKDFWSDVVIAKSKVIEADGQSRLYKIPRDPRVDISVGDYIQISQWYTSSVFRVEKLTDEYIYFFLTRILSLKGTRKTWILMPIFLMEKLYQDTE